MAFETGPSWEDPATALDLAARALHREDAAEEVPRRFAGQGDPHSLLALVEVARALGLAPRAVRADRGQLERASLPAVLHLENPLDGEDQGFVVLAEREPGAFVIAGPGGRRWVLRAGELEHLWTGVMVTFGVGPDPSQSARPARPEPGRSVARALEGRPAGIARWLIALALPLLGAVGAVRAALAGAGAMPAVARFAWVAAALLGAWMSHAALRRARAARPPGGGCVAQRPCRGGRGFDCDGLLASRWAAPGGLDLGALGLAFFVAALALLAAGAVLPPPARRSAEALLALAFLAATPLSLLLIGAQVALQRYCSLCLAAHAATLLGAAAGLAVAWPLDALSPEHLPALVAIQAAAALIAIGFVAPAGRLQHALGEAEVRIQQAGATPLGALAELLAHPTVSPLPGDTPFAWGDRAAPVRVDAWIDPGCPACRAVADELARLVENHPADLHALVHLPTRDARDPANRELRVALTAAGTLEAYHAARDRPADLRAVAAGGAQAVLDTLGLPDRPLVQARAAQSAATALADQLGNATPTILVSGKRWPRPLWELDLLLTCHPAQLAPLRRDTP